MTIYPSVDSIPLQTKQMFGAPFRLRYTASAGPDNICVHNIAGYGIAETYSGTLAIDN